MYVRLHKPIHEVPQQVQRRGGYLTSVRPVPRRLRTLGDTCWTDATSGAQVCGANDPTGEASLTVTTHYYTPTATTLAPDGTTWAFSRGGNILLGTAAGGKDKWTFTFMYHAGYADVYQRTSGADCMRSKFSCSYIQVSANGIVTFLAAPPAQSELGCSNITSAISTGTTVSTVSSTPVYTGAASYPSYPYATGSPYMTTAPAATASPAKSGFSLSSIPTWALVGGAGVGGLLVTKMLGRKR